jgi:hypothetical protein
VVDVCCNWCWAFFQDRPFTFGTKRRSRFLNLHQLLFDEPDRVPFDVELARQFEARHIVLRRRDQIHGEEPLRQRRARLVEDGSGAHGRLRAAGAALEQVARLAIGMLAPLAARTHEAVGPAHFHERHAAQVLGAVKLLEFRRGKPALELHLVARPRPLPSNRQEVQYPRPLRQHGGDTRVIRSLNARESLSEKLDRALRWQVPVRKIIERLSGALLGGLKHQTLKTIFISSNQLVNNVLLHIVTPLCIG